MKRNLIIALATVFTCQVTIAQTDKGGVKIDYDYISRKIVFAPMIQQMTKDDKYTFDMPDKLTYHRTQEDVFATVWNPTTAWLQIKARQNLVKPDYIFEVNTSGVEDIDSSVLRFYKTKVLGTDNKYKEVSGFVRDYTCHFPCSLTIRTKDGKEVRTVEIVGAKEVLTTTFHKEFLTPNNSVIPFFSELSLNDFTAYNTKQIRRRIEERVGQQVFGRITRTLAHLFNVYDSGREIYGFGFVKLKERPFDYSDLDKATTQYKTALDSMSAGNLQACTLLCDSAKAVFEKALNSNEPRIDKNVKELLVYNIAHLNLLTQHFEEAWKGYNYLLANGFDEGSRMSEELKSRIQLHQFFYQLKAKMGA